MGSKAETLSLPEIQVPEKLTVTHSLTRDWKSCRRKFFYNYLARLVPKKISIPYFIGSSFHRGMEEWYKKSDPDKFIPAIVKDMDKKAKTAVFLTPEEEQKLMFQSSIVTGMLRGYIDHHAGDLKKWKVIATEQRFEIPITDRISYAGQIDLIVKYDGKLWIVEHKTAGRLDKNYVDRLALDTQITGYAIGAKYVLKEPIVGVIYNVAKKPQLRQKQGETSAKFAARLEADYLARPEFYFYREELFRDASIVGEYKAEISELAADIDDKLEVVKRDGPAKALPHFYRNTDQCTARGPCPYLSICTKGWNDDTAKFYDVREGFNPELGNDKSEDSDD